MITLEEVDVAANDEATSTLACPAGMRVLSGSEQDGAIIGDPRTSVTIEASEPNASGTGMSKHHDSIAVDVSGLLQPGEKIVSARRITLRQLHRRRPGLGPGRDRTTLEQQEQGSGRTGRRRLLCGSCSQPG